MQILLIHCLQENGKVRNKNLFKTQDFHIKLIVRTLFFWSRANILHFPHA